MSNKDPSLKRLLGRLQKGAGLLPPTLDEASSLMEGSDEAAIEDSRLLDIAGAVVSGKPLHRSKERSVLWSETDMMSESNREQFVLNRNKGELDDDTKKKINDAEKEALSDDEQDDDEVGLDGEANPS